MIELLQLKSCRNIRKEHPLARGAVRILTTHHLRDYLRKAVRTYAVIHLRNQKMQQSYTPFSDAASNFLPQGLR